MSLEDKAREMQTRIVRADAAGARRSFLYRHFKLWRRVVDWATDYRL